MENNLEKPNPIAQPMSLHDLICQVCSRPAMYAGNHKFDCASAYIEGYYHALSLFQPDENEQTGLKDFGLWLAVKFDAPRNWAWSGIVADATPSDEEAFRRLPTLYEEFKAQARQVVPGSAA